MKDIIFLDRSLNIIRRLIVSYLLYTYEVTLIKIYQCLSLELKNILKLL